jgi:hypothetical protein
MRRGQCRIPDGDSKGGKVRFEARELNEYAEPVPPDQLQEGKVYFAVIFLDEQGMVPNMEPRVYIGSNAELEDHKLYFQDFASYQRGIRFESPHADEKATFITGVGRYLFEYERALDVLMACALRRRETLEHN